DFHVTGVQTCALPIFFSDVARVDWDHHLPKMYAFWETLLFGQISYKGNPMAMHFPINEKVAMEKEHFAHWIKLWTETVEENFSEIGRASCRERVRITE